MFKLKDYFKLSINGGVLISNVYKPYINYDWSTTTTSGLRYLKDVGSTPTYNASMYFGRGAYLNGVDQTITVPINTTIQTTLKRVNGIVTINETSQTLTNYVISGLGVHKDYYLFTRLLTTSEKDSYTNTPELFYAMAQADSTCVLNMPMCETDGYVRNMKSYSEGGELASNDYTKYSSYYGAVISSYNNKIKVANTTYSYGQARYTLSTAIGNTYVLKVFFELGTSYSGKIAIGTDGNEVIKNVQSSGEYSLVYTATSTSSYIVFEASQTSSNYILVSSITCTQQSGIHAITNYTTSVRDNAKNLRYGLQTCKFVRDSLGVIQSASDYLECDKVGYADTGWMPSASEDWTIECIAELGTTSSGFVFGLNKISQVNDRIRFVSDGAINYISCFNGFSKTASGYTGLTGIVLRFNKSTGIVDLFMNKIFHSTSSVIPISSGLSIFLAARNYNGTTVDNHYNKQIAKFKVHNKALTNEEIQAL